MEDGLSAHPVTSQVLTPSVRRCRDQWIRERSHTRRSVSECSHQRNRTENRHTRVAPTSSLSIIQTEVAPSLQAPASDPTLQNALQKDISRYRDTHYCATNETRLLLTPFGVVSCSTGLYRNRMKPYCLQR